MEKNNIQHSLLEDQELPEKDMPNEEMPNTSAEKKISADDFLRLQKRLNLTNRQTREVSTWGRECIGIYNNMLYIF